MESEELPKWIKVNEMSPSHKPRLYKHINIQKLPTLLSKQHESE